MLKKIKRLDYNAWQDGLVNTADIVDVRTIVSPLVLDNSACVEISLRNGKKIIVQGTVDDFLEIDHHFQKEE